VGSSARIASYYYGLPYSGKPFPNLVTKDNRLRLEAPPPWPYGRGGGTEESVHAKIALNHVLKGEGIPALQYPKIASMAENLRGNYRPVTIDRHNVRLWLLKDLQGEFVNSPGHNMYGYLESLQQQQAALLGITPAQYQVLAWLGGGAETGLRSTAGS